LDEHLLLPRRVCGDGVGL